jgi:serine/threonine-protein kinase
VILPHLVAEEKFEERFFQEAKLVASLGHPNIVKILDFGIENDQPYMVMEYLDHGTLQDRIGQLSAEKRTMPLEEIEPILKQIANALDYAHQNGAIHRDIKPANILFNSHGEPVLTDFGIAKLFADTAHITVTGGIVGSPKYMSPEQAASEPVGKFSDIYSLGIVIYEMATGQTPFQGDSITGVLMQHLNTPPPPPRELNPNIPQSVQAAIIRALAKKPDERYDSAGGFADTFVSALHGEATTPISQVAETIAEVPAETAVLAPTIDEETPKEAPPQPIPPAVERPSLGASLRKLPRNVLIAGLLVLVGVISVGGYLIFGDGLLNSDRQAETPDVAITLTPAGAQTTAQSDEQEDVSQITSAPGSPTAPVDVSTAAQPVPPQNIPEDPQWTSWTAGNNLYSIEFWGDLVVAGGWGGVVFRDQASGEMSHFTTGDGLADAGVLSLFVDSDNTLWVGTADGLHHFAVTGEEQAFYDSDDGLDSSSVTAMIRFDSNLLVGTQYTDIDGSGLYEDPESLSVEVTCIIQDWEGGLWVGTINGLAYYDGESWFEYNETNSELPDNYINVLYVDDNGNLWVGTDNGVVKFEEDTMTSFATLAEFSVLGIIQDQDGEYWFSGAGGIVHFNPDIGDWEYFDEDNTNLTAYTFYEAARSADGVLYFASEDAGLISYEDGNFTELSIPNLPSLASFGRIIPYKDATLIFGNEDDVYADIIDPQTETWTPFLDLHSCAPYLYDEDGNLWCIGYEGLWIMRPDGSTANLTTTHGLPSSYVTTVAFGPENSLWVGTDTGIAVLDPDTMAVLAIHDSTSAGFTDNWINALLHTSDGSMWVGIDESLIRLTPDGSWEQFTYGKPFSDYMWAIADLDEDADGGLWVATYGDGVYYYSHDAWEHFDSDTPRADFPSDDVHSVTIASNGDVWFGTDYSGAVLYREGQWHTFDIQDGLMHSNVNDIYVDAQGAVWFATSGGVSRYKQTADQPPEELPEEVTPQPQPTVETPTEEPPEEEPQPQLTVETPPPATQSGSTPYP